MSNNEEPQEEVTVESVVRDFRSRGFDLPHFAELEEISWDSRLPDEVHWIKHGGVAGYTPCTASAA